MPLTTPAFSAPLAGAARLALAALFIVSGLVKAYAFGDVAGWIGQVGLPAPALVLTLTLLLEIVGGLLLAIGWRTPLMAYVFAAFVAAATLIFHRFWAADAASFDNELTHFLKNIALIGGLLALAQLPAEEREPAPDGRVADAAH